MDIRKVINDFSKKKIAVVGDVMLDSHIHGSVERISPEAPIAVLNFKKEEYSLGGAANVAENINSLGGNAFLFGYVGQDEAKNHLMKILQEKDINNSLLPLFNHTIQKTRVIGNEQQQIVRIDKESGTKIPIGDGEILIKKIMGIDPDLIIVSDYAKGTITQDLFSRLIGLGKRVIVDPKPKNNVDYSGAYLVTPNLNEGIRLTGVNNIDEIGKILQKRYGSNILLTRGKDGMTVFERENVINLPTQAKEVSDVTGAGDSVIATMGLGIVSGLDLTDSAVLANQVAGIVVGKKGTATVSSNELERLVGLENIKIKTLEELKAIREDCRRGGKRFIWTNGCFDILHPGHTDYLIKARKLGDYLAVGLNSDTSVRQLKGDSRPINQEMDRAEVLSALECVDGVVIFPEQNVSNCLRVLEPDAYVKAGDYNSSTMDQEERGVINSYGGAFKFIPIVKNTSTTKIIEKLKRYSEKG